MAVLPPIRVGQHRHTVGFIGHFLFRESAPHDRAHPERGEEFRGNTHDIARFNRARFPDDGRVRFVSGYIRERGNIPPAIIVVGERGPTTVKTGFGVAVEYRHEPAGIPKRQRTDKDGVDDGEDSEVGADAQREREDGRRGEAGTSPQHPQTEANVPQSCLTETRAKDGAAVLAHALPVAKPLARLARRFLRCHAGGDIIRRALLEVEAQLLVNLPLHLSSLPQ